MRLLFLDFDGVLNSSDWMRKRPSPADFARAMDISPEVYDHDRTRWALRSIDPDAVTVLNDIIALSGARVVVSSTWRHMWALPKLEWMLRERGFGHHLLGATPDGQFVRDRGEERIQRGEEIAAWMRTLDPNVDPRDTVILDDDGDMHELQSRLFQTNHEHGLIAADVERIVGMYR
jgi:hypothetical protein